MLARGPKAIILSGGPASVHVEGAPSIDPAIYDAGVPLLGICYGAQLVARDLGGEVAKTGAGEYGRTALRVRSTSSLLLGSQPADASRVDEPLRRHDDGARRVSSSRRSTDGTPAAVIEDRDRAHLRGAVPPGGRAHRARPGDPRRRSSTTPRAAAPTWTNVSIIERRCRRSATRSARERVICGLSGGVDSAVAAALVHKASATSSPACSSTRACSAATKPSRWRTRSGASSRSISCT